jgi:hypothetical protein
MAIAVLFDATGTWEQYLEAMDKLDRVGWGNPEGRQYHVAGPTEGGFRIVDVWDSPAAFEEFGKVLLPIIDEVGYAPPDPQVFPADKIIQP